MKKSPKKQLEEIAKEVYSWPRYMRTYTSAGMASPKVVLREPEKTEMDIDTKSSAKSLASQMITKRKVFSVIPQENGHWLFTIEEINHPSKWELM